jgi:hypothetical protein
MKEISRRHFIKNTFGLGTALAILPHAQVLGANDAIQVATVGFRSQGANHIKWLSELPGVRYVALCDADRAVLEREVNRFREQDEKVQGYVDVRKMLEDREIDAITTATPDHWHALVTIWACQAGKDVYCEKPLCHNLWEGRQMVNAARKYNRIVQFGNQNHSHATGELQLEKEDCGRIRVAFTSLFRKRESIGKVKGPQPIPESVDYDLWTGPAPMEPLQRKNLHYDWHWVWSTGTGEIGNNGVYPLDACRLALGLKTLPKRVMSFGGRFLFHDDGTTPNTQVVLLEYEPGPLVIFELRNLPASDGPELPRPTVRCEEGRSSYPQWNGPTGTTGEYSRHQGHLYNFLTAVRSRKVEDLRSDVLEGHLSTAMVHMANISYRLGTLSSPDQVHEAIQDRGQEAEDTFERFKDHLAANGIAPSEMEVVLGPWLELDTEQEQFIGNSEFTTMANQLARGQYRAPYIIPEVV